MNSDQVPSPKLRGADSPRLRKPKSKLVALVDMKKNQEDQTLS